jgi:hypothetical protein
MRYVRRSAKTQFVQDERGRIMPKFAALALRSASIALIAAQSQILVAQIASGSATQQQPAPVPGKPDPKQQVTCRIHMDGNMPRRICLTNEQWSQVDTSRVDATSETYIDRFGRCGMREKANSGALGAC